LFCLTNKSGHDACILILAVYHRSAMLRAETTHITLDGVEYDVVLHIYGERDWRGFLIRPGSQVRIPERGSSKNEVLAKLETALKERLR
jgi:hypothetical protein